MELIINIENAIVFHVLEELVVQHGATSEHISPQALYALVVNAATTQKTTPSNPPMCDHIVCHVHILPSPITPNTTREAMNLDCCFK